MFKCARIYYLLAKENAFSSSLSFFDKCFSIFLTDSIATRVAIRDSVPLSQCDGVCRISFFSPVELLSALVLFLLLLRIPLHQK